MRVRRPWMSWAQRNELWRRWRAGESLADIAKALQRDGGRIYRIVASEGGITPLPRRRSRLALTGAVDHQPRDSAAWRTGPLSRESSRSAGVGTRPPAQAVSSGHAPRLTDRRGGEVGRAVVAATDLALASTDLSERS